MKKTKVEKDTRGLFLVTDLDLLEQLFSLPVEERTAFLAEMASKNKAEFLGTTDKTAPELATELIRKGVKAKSYIKGGQNA